MKERLMKSWNAVIEAAKGGDAEAFKTASEEHRKLLQKPENTDGGDEAKAWKDALDRVKKDVEKTQEELRKISRLGLGLDGGGRILIPGGRKARLDMLADNRAFLDDRTAHRYGAYVAYLVHLKDPHLRVEDLPDYVRGLGKEVYDAEVSGRAKDVTPDFDMSVDASGGYLFPDEFRAELIRDVEAVGKVFPRMSRVPLLEGSNLYIPKRTGGQTAYWTASGAAITQSGMTFDLVTLTAEKLGVLVGVPNEFLRNSRLLATLGNLIAVEIIYAVAYALDNAAVNGDGTGDYGGITGILQSGTLTAATLTDDHDAGSEIDAGDLDEYESQLTYDYALDQAAWGMSLSMLVQMKNQRTTTGAPVYHQGTVGAMPPTINGHPFFFSNRFPARASIGTSAKWGCFGDLRLSHYCGMVGEVAIAASEHAAFGQDVTMFRGLLSADIQERNENALVVLQTHA